MTGVVLTGQRLHQFDRHVLFTYSEASNVIVMVSENPSQMRGSDYF